MSSAVYGGAPQGNAIYNLKILGAILKHMTPRVANLSVRFNSGSRAKTQVRRAMLTGLKIWARVRSPPRSAPDLQSKIREKWWRGGRPTHVFNFNG